MRSSLPPRTEKGRGNVGDWMKTGLPESGYEFFSSSPWTSHPRIPWMANNCLAFPLPSDCTPISYSSIVFASVPRCMLRGQGTILWRRSLLPPFHRFWAQTQVARLAWQLLYWLSHLAGFYPSVKKKSHLPAQSCCKIPRGPLGHLGAHRV